MMAQRSGDGTQTDTAMASAHLSERREARYAASFEIEVTWLNETGHLFHEKTLTLNVSEWGCAFLSSLGVAVDEIISVRRIASEDNQHQLPVRQAFFQVVRTEPRPGGRLVGAWKMDDADFWGADLEKLAKPKESRPESRGQEERAATSRDQ
jgi:hypothetical protein